jgi:iron complex transport system ATP-binding protein
MIVDNRITNHEAAIELSGVGVRRGGRWLLRDINWSVAGGGVAAIIGPNGCGKSTLARVLSGYMFPTAGTVRVFGKKFGEVDLNEVRRSIRLIQAGGPYEADPQLTALEIVQTGVHGTIGLFDPVAEADVERSRVLVRQVGLEQVADRPWSTLSSGERVRTLVARAFVQPPSLLLLDELTAGLDLLAREQVLAALQQLADRPGHATTMLMITHHLEELLPTTSSVLLLSNGQVAAAGRPEEVLRGESLSAAYGVPVQVETINGRFYPRVDPSAWKGLIGGV